MFGIKTALKKLFCLEENSRLLVNTNRIRYLMEYFKTHEAGHRANIDTSDMGYGWIHYGFIRLIKPQRVLCVGSGYGYIPAVLAQACHDNGFGHVDFVDAGYGFSHRHNWTWTGYWKTLEGQASFKSFGLGNYITIYLMKTQTFVKKYPSLMYDYIYIDGDHLYGGVSFDYKHLWPRLRTNGFMAFHDVSIKEKQPEGKYGVWKLWKEISGKHSITLDHPASGLGIIQKYKSNQD